MTYEVYQIKKKGRDVTFKYVGQVSAVNPKAALQKFTGKMAFRKIGAREFYAADYSVVGVNSDLWNYYVGR